MPSRDPDRSRTARTSFSFTSFAARHDVQMAVGRIIANGVGARFELDRTDDSQALIIQQLDRVAAISDQKLVLLGDEKNAVRRLKSTDRLEVFHRTKIEHLQRGVILRGEETAACLSGPRRNDRSRRCSRASRFAPAGTRTGATAAEFAATSAAPATFMVHTPTSRPDSRPDGTRSSLTSPSNPSIGGRLGSLALRFRINPEG